MRETTPKATGHWQAGKENVALFADALEPDFVGHELKPWLESGRVCLMTADETLLPAFAADDRLPLAKSLPDRP